MDDEGSPWFWISVVVLTVGLLFIMVYHLLAFDELKNDHRNPVDVCKSVNPWVLVEYGIQAFLTLMMLFSGNYFCFLFNLVVVIWHGFRYSKRPKMDEPGIYDPTDVFNRNEVSKNINECSLKLGFYLLSFFYYLYCMMFALLA